MNQTSVKSFNIVPRLPEHPTSVLDWSYTIPFPNLLLRSDPLHHTVFCPSPRAPAVLSSGGLVSSAIEDGFYTGLREAHEREAAAKA